jgi:hypothetical protein
MSIIGRNKKGSLADQLNFGNKPTEEKTVEEKPKEEKTVEEKPKEEKYEWFSKIVNKVTDSIGNKTAAEVATEELKKLKEKQQKK